MNEPAPGTDATPPTLRELLPAHLDMLTAFVRQRLRHTLRDRESACDVVDSICGDLLAEGVAFEYRTQVEFHGWLRQVVANKIRSRLRHHGARKRGPDLLVDAGESQIEAACVDPATPSQDAVLHEDLSLLDRALARLPDDYRDLLVQIHLRGRSHAEVARATGRTVDATRQQLKRAKARLAGQLDRLQRGS